MDSVTTWAATVTNVANAALDNLHYYCWDGCFGSKDKEETMYLWEVFGVYSAVEGCIQVFYPKCGYVAAETEEKAKIKSGIYKAVEEGWDTEYVTIFAKNMGAVKVPKKKDK